MNADKLATLLLNVFGYPNATEADVIPIEVIGSGYCITYMLIEFHQCHIQFRKIKSDDGCSWEMIKGV